MNVLVTGGAGFIGSHIVDAHVKAGDKVTVVDNLATGKRDNVNSKAHLCVADVSSPEITRIFAEGKFDLVSHHAAQASVSVSVKEPLMDARVNILGMINLLENCLKHRVRKMIFASSGGTVYGAVEKLPADESLPFAAGSPYGVSKVASELYMQVYAAQHGLKCTALRYGNVYGPRQDPFGEAGVIAIFAEKMLGQGKPVIHGDGEYLRDYVYVGDVVRANMLASTKGDGEGINIGTGVATSTNTIFRVLKEATAYPHAEEHGPPRPGDLRANYLANAKAKKVLGWSPEINLEQGLRLTVDWFKGRAKA